ncbi:MAG: CPBP family intramembrane metalloprotease [Rhodospirillales bacterium]|nr:CPBP family intramembrane metalloprotease [Rhodospirillales bacterium]
MQAPIERQETNGKPRTLIPKRIGIILSTILFGIPALLPWLVTDFGVPALVARGWNPLLAWFLAGTVVFAPLLAAAIFGASMTLSTSSPSMILEHLRVHHLSFDEWRLTALALAWTATAIAVLSLLNANVWPGLPTEPSFMTIRPLKPPQYYLFALWLPYFAVNIIGEELWWRGFIQPRQEPVFGRSTRIIQGLLHGAFHFSFGAGVVFIVWPVLFGIPWLVQRTRIQRRG